MEEFIVLIGDIGGTNTRLKLISISKSNENQIKDITDIQIFKSNSFPSLTDILKMFLKNLPLPILSNF